MDNFGLATNIIKAWIDRGWKDQTHRNQRLHHYITDALNHKTNEIDALKAHIKDLEESAGQILTGN